MTTGATESVSPMPPTRPPASLRVRAHGKFLFRGNDKFVVRGVSYGPFAPGPDGMQFPVPEVVRRDFALMQELGANTLRTFTVPPGWVLDLAAENHLGVLAGIPWTQHVCFLDDDAVSAAIRDQVRAGIDACAGHSAVVGCLIGNEIPPDVVRWHGARRVSEFLRTLHALVKDRDPEMAVSYANFPPTEYLDLDFLDFVSFNVYLHRERDFRRYLSRLQNLAADRPLVLTEFGIDAVREGATAQAEILEWQVRAAFEGGVAGAVVFAWTDDWFTGGAQIEEWAFGLVDRSRGSKPAFDAVRRLYTGSLPPLPPNPPRISVVICAYNAERTLDACLASLQHLRYPNYEVIVVDDGSTDVTPAIAGAYPEVRTVSQENRGLSAARNVGCELATGAIVAYTDADCVADPDWLTHLAVPFARGFVAVGGPNLPPPEDGLVPACVAAAPGGPTHVLIDDEIAEHIPGCNMAFRRDVLVRLGGFDPIHRAAGDDVDMCWRLQDAGYQIGFSPAALVWHFRRNTIGAYLKQQMGYGHAEAQLYFKHPFRFNLLGQSQWMGRIYNDLGMAFLSRRPVIYHGVFGRGLFQTLYEPPASMFAYLPFTLEWNLVGVVVLLGAMIAGRHELLASAPLLIALGAAVARAARARLDPRYDGPGSRVLIALLVYLGPLVRSAQRYVHRLGGATDVERIQFSMVAEPPRVEWWRRRFYLDFWSDSGREKEDLLHATIAFLVPRKYLTAVDQGWNDCDVIVHRGIWSQADVKVAVENHGGPRRLFRVRSRVRETPLARLGLAGLCAVGFVAALGGLRELSELAVALTVILGGTVLYDNFRLGRTLYHVLEIVAAQTGLGPVGPRGTP